MYKIQTLNEISGIIHRHLSAENYLIAREEPVPDAILVRSADMHSMPLPDSLLAIGRAGAGTNNIPIDECNRRGIVVFNTPGANANGVKELVLAGMLLASRHLIEATSWVKSLKGTCDDVLAQVEKGKKQFVGPELLGKTLGVIGLGAIGVMVANAARSLGMKVIGYDPYISIESAWGLSHDVQRALNMDQLLSVSDYVTLHVPLMDNTKRFIGEAEIAKMKPGAVLLNFARNGLVEYEPLLKALDEGRLFRYVTDFPNARLLEHEKVISIPHLGASTPESEENCAKMAAMQLRDYLETGDIVNSVNMPCAVLPFTGRFRIAVIHKNISGMVGKMTAILAASGANITDMVNKSRGDIAYTLINLDENVPKEAVEEIRRVGSVIRVRTFTK